MRKHAVVCGLIAGAVSAVAALGQETKPAAVAAGPAVAATQGAATQGASTQAAEMESHWGEMVKKLSSDDFQEREGAQKELEKTTWKDRELLRKLAGVTADAEAKARVETRIEQLDEEMATNPPPISLEVKNASLLEVVKALNKEMQGALGGSLNEGFIGRSRFTYTLSVKDKPFWEVFQALSTQHGIMLQQWNDMGIQMNEPGLKTGLIVGSLAVFPQSITRQTAISLQQPAGEQTNKPNLTLQLLVALDPRVQMSKMGRPMLTEVVDDAGNVLLKQQPDKDMNMWGGQATHVWDIGETLKIPEKPGKRIVSVKGEMRYEVELASRKVEITDAEKKLNEPQDLGKITVTITKFELKDNVVQFSIQSKRSNAVAGALQGIMPRNTEPPPLRVTFIDADGKRFWSTSLPAGGSTGGGAGGSNIRGPVKVELKVPTKTKEVVVPFELKDLPMPQS